MENVINDYLCPNCESDNCYEELNYKTAEFHIQCLDCGFVHILKYQRDDDGEFVKRDATKGELDVENLIVEETKISNPFGSVTFMPDYQPLHCKSLENEDDFDEFMETVGDHYGNVDVTLSRFVNGKLVKVVYKIEKEV